MISLNTSVPIAVIGAEEQAPAVNLKPLAVRKVHASAVIRRLQPELARVQGVTLYMQPVQDLTIEDRVSRTQFQFILEDPDADRLGEWVPKLITRLRQAPELQDVASDFQARLSVCSWSRRLA